jgi:hypothetical protein
LCLAGFGGFALLALALALLGLGDLSPVVLKDAARAPSRWQRESMIRAARSIGAVRTRRIGREWLWRLPDAVAHWR